MASHKVRKRFWLASFTGVLGAVLFVLTLITPDWIEKTLHVDPDGGNGRLELAIVVGLLAVTAVIRGVRET